MGLNVNVLRHAGFMDCTNGGVSSKFDRFCVTNLEGPFEPDETTPALRIVKGAVPLSLTAVLEQPEDWPTFTRGGIRMFGGNHIASSDARFSRGLTMHLINHWGGQYTALHELHNTLWVLMGRPLPLHDRYE